MWQLYVRLPPYAERLDQRQAQLANLLSNAYFNTAELWNSFVVDPLREMDSLYWSKIHPNKPRCFAILIDALDESGTVTDPRNNDLLRILERFVDSLPLWIKIIVTGRPESHILQRIGDKPHVLIHSIEPEDEANRNDVKKYISTTIEPFVSPEELDSATLKIYEKCKDLFLAARLMLSEQGSAFCSLLQFSLVQSIIQKVDFLASPLPLLIVFILNEFLKV